MLNWQQDPAGNWVARLVFPHKTNALTINVDLVAELAPFNPFDFFVDAYAVDYPFAYQDSLRRELSAYLGAEPVTPRFAERLESVIQAFPDRKSPTVDMLVGINRRVQSLVRHIVRREPGVQTPERTLESKQGSCRDSAWLLVQLLRHLGLAARFVSGYLIQLETGAEAGSARDITELHAWAEVYIPGAGWIGLDPTTGLLAAEGHIPLACTALPATAAPVIGSTEVCKVDFDYSITVTRLPADPHIGDSQAEAQQQQ
jgi:transglutaminase-like putative cysteine protease